MNKFRLFLITSILTLVLCSCGKESPFGKTEVTEKELNTANYQVPAEWAEETTKDVNLHFPGGTADPNSSYIMIAFIDDLSLEEYIDGISENGAENLKKEEVTIDSAKGYKISFTIPEDAGSASCVMYSVSTDDGIYSAANTQPSGGEDYSEYLEKIVHTMKFK